MPSDSSDYYSSHHLTLNRIHPPRNMPNEANENNNTLSLGASIPDDVWLHHILPRLRLADVLAVGSTCHRLRALTVGLPSGLS